MYVTDMISPRFVCNLRYFKDPSDIRSPWVALGEQLRRGRPDGEEQVNGPLGPLHAVVAAGQKPPKEKFI